MLFYKDKDGEIRGDRIRLAPYSNIRQGPLKHHTQTNYIRGSRIETNYDISTLRPHTISSSNHLIIIEPRCKLSGNPNYTVLSLSECITCHPLEHT